MRIFLFFLNPVLFFDGGTPIDISLAVCNQRPHLLKNCTEEGKTMVTPYTGEVEAFSRHGGDSNITIDDIGIGKQVGYSKESPYEVEITRRKKLAMK